MPEIQLKGGPRHGDVINVHPDVAARGYVQLLHREPDPFLPEDDDPPRTFPQKILTYRIRRLASGPPGHPATRYWFEWHYETPAKENPDHA